MKSEGCFRLRSLLRIITGIEITILILTMLKTISTIRSNYVHFYDTNAFLN
jgi:hypothetical protein